MGCTVSREEQDLTIWVKRIGDNGPGLVASELNYKRTDHASLLCHRIEQYHDYRVGVTQLFQSDDRGLPDEGSPIPVDFAIHPLQLGNNPMHPIWFRAANNLRFCGSNRTTALSSTVGGGGGAPHTIWAKRIGNVRPGLVPFEFQCRTNERIGVIMHRIELHHGRRFEATAVYLSDSQGHPNRLRLIDIDENAFPLCQETSVSRPLWFTAENYVVEEAVVAMT